MPLPAVASPISTPRVLMLLAPALAVTMSYGVTLPLLPQLLPRLSNISPDEVARHTGWVTGVYTLALFAFSAPWGLLSDRIDRRWVIAAALAGSAALLWALELVETIASLYALRILSGTVAAAVLPAVFAYVVETSTPAQRQRRFAWVASATALGFLLGPVAAERLALPAVWSGTRLVAVLCGAAAALALALPPPVRAAPDESAAAPRWNDRWMLRSLLLTAAVVFAITVAEVGLTLTTQDVAIYFALCSTLMLGVQLWAYPRLERKLGEHRLVVLSFAAMTAALALLAWPASWSFAVSFILAGSAIGVLVPALAVRISVAAGARQGWAMGRQAAAANLGQAIAAALTGVLFSAAPAAPFLLASFVMAAGCWLASRARGPARR